MAYDNIKSHKKPGLYPSSEKHFKNPPAFFDLKPLYLHYHNAYNHETWQDSELPSSASNHNVVMTLWLRHLWKSRDKVKWYLHYSRLVTYPKKILPINSNYSRVRDHVTNIFPLQQCLSPPSVARWWVTLRGLYPKGHMTLWSHILWNHVKN